MLFIFLQLLHSFSVAWGSGGVGYSLVVIGSNACPHCNRLHKFFEATYSEDRWVFLPVESVGAELLYKIAVTEVNHGLDRRFAGAVPHTLVFNDGVLVAIVIGDIEVKEFWDSIMKLNASDRVPVYIGDTIVIEIPRSDLTILSDLEAILVNTTTPQTTTPPSSMPTTMIIILVVASVMILLTCINVRRKR